MADMTFNFNLKPNTTTLDLGDSTNKWQNLYVGTIAATTLQAPTTSGGSTLGVGSSGQFLSSNGTSSYWASLPTASTSAAGIIQIGTGATNACAGNDSRLSDARTPTSHATTSTTYGGATASNYGHVALTDTYATVSTSQKAANSIAASAWALQTAYTTLNSNKVATSAIVNNLTTESAGYVLDARQGKILNDKFLHYLGCAAYFYSNNAWTNTWTLANASYMVFINCWNGDGAASGMYTVRMNSSGGSITTIKAATGNTVTVSGFNITIKVTTQWTEAEIYRLAVT